MKFRKKPEVEQRIGMTIAAYIEKASQRGLKQKEMASELGVQEMTMGRWLRDAGYEQRAAYKRVAA